MSIELENEFTVQDSRVSPYVSIPSKGSAAISKGLLDAKEISVYVVVNMILDGMIKVKEGVTEKDVIAHCTGLTPRQVSNIYAKLHEKGIVEISGDEVLI